MTEPALLSVEGVSVDLPTPREATPEALTAQLKASIDLWVPAVRAAGVKPE